MSISTDRFDICLRFVLAWEGGLSDDPADPGGRTMKGILQREYDGYRRSHSQPVQDVAKISDAEVEDIYKRQYWIISRAAYMPPPLDLVHFDTAVNEGIGRATETLADTLGLSKSMVWTTELSGAVHAITDPKAVASKYISDREAFYKSLAEARPRLGRFLKGWLNRCEACRKAAGL